MTAYRVDYRTVNVRGRDLKSYGCNIVVTVDSVPADIVAHIGSVPHYA